MIKVNGDVKKITTLDEIRQSKDIVEIEGAVHKLRDMGGFCFILVRTLNQVVQVVWDIDGSGDYKCHEGDWVKIKGSVVEDKRSKLGFEIHGKEINVVSKAKSLSPVPINKGKVNLHMDNHLKHRPAVLRNPSVKQYTKYRREYVEDFVST